MSFGPIRAKVALYAAKTDRLRSRCARIERFEQCFDLDHARLVLHSGGPLPMARDATGDLHAYVELSGMKPIDWLPLTVAAEAGCTVRTPGHAGVNFRQLEIPEADSIGRQLLDALYRRHPFLVAANEELADRVEETFFR